MGTLASVPVLVRVEGAAPVVPAPVAPRTPYGSLPVTGGELLLVVLAVLAVAAGLLLRKVAR